MLTVKYCWSIDDSESTVIMSVLDISYRSTLLQKEVLYKSISHDIHDNTPFLFDL